MFAMRASELKGAGSRSPVHWSFWGLENTAKTVLFENAGLENPQKRVVFATCPRGRSKSRKHAKTRVFASRSVPAPSVRRRKNTQKHVLLAAGLGKDTQKRVLFRGSSPKTRKNT